jgi:prevent-host-death family protein
MCYMGRKAKSSKVGVRELRQNLSVYLDRVKKGEALTVTEHGTAVAILRPLPPTSSVLDRLVAEGVARPATRSIRDIPRPLLKGKLDKPLSEILREMRDEERY